MGYKQPGYMAHIWLGIKWKVQKIGAAVKEHFTTYRAIKKARAKKFLPSRPKPLSGRKLERAALREYGISRHPGETDEELNRRCFDIAEAEYANQPDWRRLENE